MKPLPDHLEYVYLEKYSLLPVIISSLLKDNEKECLVYVLKNHKEAFAWKTYDIPGISMSFCKHKSNLEDNVKPVIQRQCRLNSNMKEKGGMIVVTDEKNELVPTRTFTGWRIKNKKGAESVAAYHLLRLENPNLVELREDEIDDNLLDETLMRIKNDDEEIPWFIDFSNYLVGKIPRKRFNQRCKIFTELEHYFWEEPYLFKMSHDGMIRICVYGPKTQKVLDECHHGPTVGYSSPSTTTK
ncbi:hypothetical protein Tco_0733790 [Tanacetum coccineum]